MKRFTFYYEELVGGHKYKEVIEAKTFRQARDIFFNKHQNISHRIDAIWNHETNEKLK